MFFYGNRTLDFVYDNSNQYELKDITLVIEIGNQI